MLLLCVLGNALRATNTNCLIMSVVLKLFVKKTHNKVKSTCDTVH